MLEDVFEKAKLIDRKLNTVRGMISKGEICSCDINYLFKEDEDFKKDVLELREKYITKYKKEFKEL